MRLGKELVDSTEVGDADTQEHDDAVLHHVYKARAKNAGCVNDSRVPEGPYGSHVAGQG